MTLIGKLVVCGVGLIGGSFALALRQAGVVGRIEPAAVTFRITSRRSTGAVSAASSACLACV